MDDELVFTIVLTHDEMIELQEATSTVREFNNQKDRAAFESLHTKICNAQQEGYDDYES